MVSTGASAVNFFVARLLARVGRQRRSITLEADAKHLMTDVWTSLVVVTTVLLIALTGWWWLDPLLGILLALHIMAVAVRLMKASVHGLMDSALAVDEIALIRAILDRRAQSGIRYHALRTRQAGALQFMSVHLLMPGEWNISKGHTLVEEVEKELREALPGLIVFTHMEPLEDPSSWEDIPLRRK